MTMFGSLGQDEPPISDEQIAAALAHVKRRRSHRRSLLIAPAILGISVVTAFVAAPPRYGDIELVADAGASAANEMPWVFGQNGVWKFAEPIAEPIATSQTPPNGDTSEIAVFEDMQRPQYTLVPHDAAAAKSFPVPMPTPPASALGQILRNAGTAAGSTDSASLEEPLIVDWTEFALPVRTADPLVIMANPPAAIDDESLLPALDAEQSAPDGPAPAELSTTEIATATAIAIDESTLPEPSVPTDGVVPNATSDVDDATSANPSTHSNVVADEPSTASASPVAVGVTVLVHSAHVSVSIQVVDEDSRVLDRCNTMIDWGDGRIDMVSGVDEQASCAAACEQQAGSSTPGSLTERIVFEHTYETAIEASPIVTLVTADDCVRTSTVLHLNPFVVLPF